MTFEPVSGTYEPVSAVTAPWFLENFSVGLRQWLDLAPKVAAETAAERKPITTQPQFARKSATIFQK